MRKLNKIELISPHWAILGPGGTWEDVLEKIPPEKYTLLHGQCLSVGVGGYILGGGVNVVGTSDRYGFAAEHVKQYTMVDAQGNILLVSKNNISTIEPYTRKLMRTEYDKHDLFYALKGKFKTYSFSMMCVK